MQEKNALQVFDFAGEDVRIIERAGEPWFVAKDVADILGYSDTQAMTRRVEDEDDIGTYTDTSSGQVRHLVTINESGLYTAILGSAKKEAKTFKHWVTHEVLPSIRKHGGYVLNQETLSNDEILARAVLVANNVIAEKQKTGNEKRAELEREYMWRKIRDFNRKYSI